MKKLLFMLVLASLVFGFNCGFFEGQEASNDDTVERCCGEIKWLDEQLSANQTQKIISPQAPLGQVRESNYQVYEYAYTQLNQAEQSAYQEIVSVIEKNRWKQYTEVGDYRVICVVDLSNYGLTEEELKETFWSVLCDHIEMFYVSGDFWGYVNNEEAYLYVLAAELDNVGMEPCDIDTQLKAFASDALSGLNEEDDSAHKTRYLFQYVMDNMSYAEDANGIPVMDSITSSLACTVQRQGICSGYAKVFTYLCNCIEVPAIYVTGYTEEGYHAWNYVNLDDMWYACDATYSDCGVEVFLQGKQVYSTHQPVVYGVNTYDFCYPYPELAEKEYYLLLEEENCWEGEMADSESDNEMEQEQEQEQEQEEIWGNEYTEDKAEMIEENQTVINDNETTESAYPNFPRDSVYWQDGEPFVNGLPAELYYVIMAQNSNDVRDKISYTFEALMYAPEDENLYFNLGVYYSGCNDYNNAFYYYLRAIEKGDITGAVDNIIQLIEKTEMVDLEKEAAYRLVLGLVPNDTRILNKVGES